MFVMNIIVLMLLLISTVAVAGEMNGMVAWWDFDEGSGDIAYDKMGNNNHTKITGAAWIKCGKGYALKFDGLDDVEECGRLLDSGFSSEMTFEAWVYERAISASGLQIFGSYYEDVTLTFEKYGNS